MSVLLFVVGAIAVMVGVGMVGYGVPINEFSFGNTLIVAGTTAAVGGLIVIAIGAAVMQLQRIAETLATRTPVRSSRPFDVFEPVGARAAAARVPFPPKPKAGTAMREAEPAETPMDTPSAEKPAEEAPVVQAAPTLRNPEAPAVAVVEQYEIEEYEEVPLSPQHPTTAPAPAEPEQPAPVAEKQPEPALEAPWRSSPAAAPQPRQSSYFDAMWPAEARPTRSPASEMPPEPMPELPYEAPEPVAQAKPEQAMIEDEAPRAVAILKSGVVDGMGYTLYVDGSIEAELPNGTLHFASINELRAHLAKNS